ncbi:hypothetical protein MMA231_01106 [Asticcacaulis sp. MM231]|uniref:hypothetical protein n=1 Tax=Asticcacaulis sp. MM231 TaxID=3157666 RepID=UPI0032D595C8
MIRKTTSVVILTGLLVACSPQKKTDEAPQAPASSAVASAAPMAVDTLSCAGPVKQGDTAKSLMATYGKDATLGMIPGAEGTEEKGLILFDKDSKHRLEVLFADEAMTQVSLVMARGTSTAWKGPEGLHLGSKLGDIELANGRAFTVGGFDWDYGGYVSDLKGGRLAEIPGGCMFGLRMGFAEDNTNPVPDSLIGERTLDSGDPVLKKASPVVQEMTIGWSVAEPAA